MIARRLSALWRGSRREDGIVILWALAATVIVLGLSAAALAAVTNDTSGTGADTAQKQAYTAAEAGIQRYLYELNTNPSYWTQCVPSGSNWIVNTGQSGTPQAVPGSPTANGVATEKYLVMLLPAVGQNTYTSCNTSDPTDSMIQQTQPNAGTLRISATGYSGTATRTVVAAIRQQNFLDYAYFTDYETADPYVEVDDAFNGSPANQNSTASPSATNNPAGYDLAIEPPEQCGGASTCGTQYGTAYSDANTQCTQWRYQGRENTPFFSNSYTYNQQYLLNFLTGSSTANQSFSCENIEFIAGDQINGPFRSDDSVLLCGSPSFGQSGYQDSVMFRGDPNVYPNGWTEASGCSGSPTVNGNNLTKQANYLGMPNILQLQNVANTTYSGTTCLILGASSYQVAQLTAGQSCTTSNGLSYTTASYPSNGVIYVKNSASASCSYSYDVDDPIYTVSSSNVGCGTVFVKGTPGASVTIGSAYDTVIDGNITYANSTAMLGLIANGFIRVYHPVVGGVCTNAGASNSLSTPAVSEIDAAMLSVQHSFIVDNYSCGNNLGTLKVVGAIAQDYRGPVGQGSSGYTKNYVYDRRLQYTEPPQFLAPSNGSYAIAYQTECDTATSCDGTS